MQVGIQRKIILEKYKNEEKLWNLFDQNNYDTLINIPWKNFRRALKLTEEIPSRQASKTLIMQIAVIIGELQNIERGLVELEHRGAFPTDRVTTDYVEKKLQELHNMSDELSNKLQRTRDLLVVADVAGHLELIAEGYGILLTSAAPSDPQDKATVRILFNALAELSARIKILKKVYEIARVFGHGLALF